MIDPSKSSLYNITIQCALDGFCFVLHHQEENKIIDIELYQTSESAQEDQILEALEKAFYNKGLHGKSFRSIRFLIANRYYTLVPESLFDANNPESYLRFNHLLPHHYAVFHEAVPSAQAVNVYAIPQQFLNRLRATWPEAVVRHQSSLFLQAVQREEPYESNTNVYVNVNSRDFDLVILQEGRLLFFNNFRFNTKDDFAYFLMFTLEQQLPGVKDLPVSFTGLISNQSEIIRLCERYIKRIRFIRPNGSVEVEMALNNMPFQYYYIPYQSLSCES
jgi:hypothetical protein